MAVLGDHDPSVGLLHVGDQLGEPVADISQWELMYSHKYRQIRPAWVEDGRRGRVRAAPTLARVTRVRSSASRPSAWGSLGQGSCRRLAGSQRRELGQVRPVPSRQRSVGSDLGEPGDTLLQLVLPHLPPLRGNRALESQDGRTAPDVADAVAPPRARSHEQR